MEGVNVEKAQVPESGIQAIVEWLNLGGIPTAGKLDPNGELGLKEVFRKNNGVYADLLPSSVVDQAKKDVIEDKVRRGSILIPLLGQTKIKGRIVPLFKEQVDAAAQYLRKLGIEIPASPEIKGKGFVMQAGNAKEKTRITTASGRIISKFRTKDANVFVQIKRERSSDGPTTSIGLLIKR